MKNIIILFFNSISPLVINEKVLEINCGKVTEFAKKKKPLIAWIVIQQKKTIFKKIIKFWLILIVEIKKKNFTIIFKIKKVNINKKNDSFSIVKNGLNKNELDQKI